MVECAEENEGSADVCLDILENNVKTCAQKDFLGKTVSMYATALTMGIVTHSPEDVYVVWGGWDRPVRRYARQASSGPAVFIPAPVKIKRLVTRYQGAVVAYLDITGKAANYVVQSVHMVHTAGKDATV